VVPDLNALKIINLILDQDRTENMGVLRSRVSIVSDFEDNVDARAPDLVVKEWILNRVLLIADKVILNESYKYFARVEEELGRSTQRKL
jgi:hypothetical protein